MDVDIQIPVRSPTQRAQRCVMSLLVGFIVVVSISGIHESAHAARIGEQLATFVMTITAPHQNPATIP